MVYIFHNSRIRNKWCYIWYPKTINTTQKKNFLKVFYTFHLENLMNNLFAISHAFHVWLKKCYQNSTRYATYIIQRNIHHPLILCFNIRLPLNWVQQLFLEDSANINFEFKYLRCTHENRYIHFFTVWSSSMENGKKSILSLEKAVSVCVSVNINI